MGEYGYRPDIKGPSKWKRLTKMAEMAGLAAILSFAAPESAPAQEGAVAPDSKDKMGEVMKLGKEAVDKILGLLETKGQEGVMGMNAPIRRWVSPDQSRAKAGYGPDKKTVQWVAIETGDGKKCYIDFGGDGLVDRVVYEEKGTLARRIAENELKALSPMDNLAETAEAEADLDPQQVRVIDFSKTNDGQERLRSINYQTGEASELTGPEAEALLLKVQQGFVDSAKTMGAEMEE